MKQFAFGYHTNRTLQIQGNVLAKCKCVDMFDPCVLEAGCKVSSDAECPAIELCKNPLTDVRIWMSLLGLCQAVLWSFLFVCLEQDTRRWAASVMARFMLLAFVSLWLLPLSVDQGMPLVYNVFGLAAIILTVAGPARTAQVPLVGPYLVRSLISQAGSQCCFQGHGYIIPFSAAEADTDSQMTDED